MSMRVTMRDPRRSEDGLSVLLTGQTYTVSDDYGRFLVSLGAVDTDGVIASRTFAAKDEVVSDEARATRALVSDDGIAAREQVGRAGLSWANDWDQWNGGLARYLRVGDGLSPSVARECISAYGDAVLPQITEAIGHSILRVEAALAAVTSDSAWNGDAA